MFLLRLSDTVASRVPADNEWKYRGTNCGVFPHLAYSVHLRALLSGQEADDEVSVQTNM